jgi:ketosteroid isomerase-like protein
MSQENMEVARRLEEAINARSIPSDLLTADFVMVNATTAVTDKTYYGVSGAQEWLEDFLEAFAPGSRFVLEDVVADEREFLVARVRIDGTGASSGAPLVFRWSAVLHCVSGRLTKVVGYLRLREALKSVGLEE